MLLIKNNKIIFIFLSIFLTLFISGCSNSDELKEELNDYFSNLGKTYYENGNIKSEGNYINGKIEGEFKHYFENGNIEFIINYKNGNLSGEAKEYYENGNIKYISNYENDVLEGEFISYNMNGDIEKKGTYKNRLIDNSINLNISKKIKQHIIIDINKINVIEYENQKYFVMNIEIENIGSEKIFIFSHNFILLDNNKNQFQVEPIVEFPGETYYGGFQGDIYPGVRKKEKFIFNIKIYDNLTLKKLIVEDVINYYDVNNFENEEKKKIGDAKLKGSSYSFEYDLSNIILKNGILENKKSSK